VDPADSDILANKGLALYESGNFPDAILALDSAIEKDPNNIHALKGKGRALMATDEFESAITVFDRILEALPDNIESWVSKAEAYMSLGRFEGAIGCYERAIDLDEHNKSHWINKGMLHDRTAKYEDAIKSYDHALKIDDKDASIWHKKGMSLSKIGDFEAALGCYDRALGLSPENKQIWTSKGLVLNNMENFEQAVRCFDHALERDGKFMPAKEGKERSERAIKKKNIERFAKNILNFEKDYRRPATKEEAFKVCHIPFEYLDSVIKYLSEKVEVDIKAMSLEERDRFERDSNRAIVGAFREDPASFEKHGIRLADIVMGFPNYDIPKAKRLLAYIHTVDNMEIKLDSVDPDLEELLSKALEFPPSRRTLPDLITDLNLGIYDAKRVYALVQQFGGEEVATPEVRVRSLGGDYGYEMGPEPEGFMEPQGEPLDYDMPEEREEPEPEEDLCLICDENEAVIEHDCGAKLCKSCLDEYNKRYAKLYDGAGDEILCPKCSEPVVMPKRRKGKKGDADYIRL
jgi:tetratricopeptide (TPR) repeat protein